MLEQSPRRVSVFINMEKIWLLIFVATMFCQFQLYKAADKKDIPETIKNGVLFIVLGVGMWTVILIDFLEGV